MKLKPINSSKAPSPVGPYTQALELTQYDRVLFISGQIPVAVNGSVPESFEEQCDLTWRNVIAQLEEAKMDVNNLVKETTYVASRDHLGVNRDIRHKHLQGHSPALTIIISGIFDETGYWKLKQLQLHNPSFLPTHHLQAHLVNVRWNTMRSK